MVLNPLRGRSYPQHAAWKNAGLASLHNQGRGWIFTRLRGSTLQRIPNICSIFPMAIDQPRPNEKWSGGMGLRNRTTDLLVTSPTPEHDSHSLKIISYQFQCTFCLSLQLFFSTDSLYREYSLTSGVNKMCAGYACNRIWFLQSRNNTNKHYSSLCFYKLQHK